MSKRIVYVVKWAHHEYHTSNYFGAVRIAAAHGSTVERRIVNTGARAESHTLSNIKHGGWLVKRAMGVK